MTHAKARYKAQIEDYRRSIQYLWYAAMLAVLLLIILT